MAHALRLLAFAALAGCFGGPGYRGPRSDHFDGERFVNQVRTEHRAFPELMRWQATRTPSSWREVGGEPGPPPPRRVEGERLRVTWVGHATVLVQTAGVNVLTDPVWSPRVGPLSWLGVSRVRPPGLRFEDLPRIDAVVLSHDHYDHLDLPTLRRLAARDRPLLLGGLGTKALLDGEGIPGGFDLDWWDARRVGALEIHAAPVRHFSGRGLEDRDATLWCSWALVGPGGVVYFGGDTGFGPHFAQVRDRFGPPRAALLPIGAYLPRWFMGPIHLSPAEAVLAHRVLGARRSVPIHWGTFPLADDRPGEAVYDLALARNARGVSDAAFRPLPFGVGAEL